MTGSLGREGAGSGASRVLETGCKDSSIASVVTGASVRGLEDSIFRSGGRAFSDRLEVGRDGEA